MSTNINGPSSYFTLGGAEGEMVGIPRKQLDQYQLSRRNFRCCSVLALLMLVVSIVFMVHSYSIQAMYFSAKKDLNSKLNDRNQEFESLQNENQQLKLKIRDLNETINSKNAQTSRLYYYKELELGTLQLQSLKIATSQRQAEAPVDQLPVIKRLNLSGNSIVQFSDTVLYDLEALDLSKQIVNTGSNPLKTFQRNSLPSVTQLKLSTPNPNEDPGVGSLGFDSNTLPLVDRLVVPYKSLNNSFTGNNLTMLNELIIQLYNPTSFQNNVLPNLRKLTLVASDYQRNKLTTLSSNNSIPNLQYLNVQNNSLNNLAELLKTFPMLQQADLTANNFTSAIQLNHSTLNQLRLDLGQLNSFSNNNFPELKYLHINGNTDLTTFQNNQLPALIQLHLPNCQIANFNAAVQFGKLEVLSLSGNSDMTNNNFSIDNSVGPLRVLDLTFTALTDFSGYTLNKLQELMLNNTNVASFTNNTFPALTYLDISQCSLTKFECATLSNLNSLDISNNNNTELGKGIVETLLSCNLTSLRSLNLGTFGYNSVNTSISDKEGARTRLKQYYPNITSLSL